MTKKPDDWMPLDVRKYLGDTMHLGREEHGAYLLLIMAYWMRGASLADSDQELAAIVRASRIDWKRLRPIMEPFFDVREGRWYHGKIEKELARARELVEKKSKSGKAGAQARWGTDGEPDGKRMADALPVPLADALPEQWQTDAPVPVPIPVEEKERDMPAEAGVCRVGKSRYPEEFEEFWETFKGPKNAKKPEGLKAWKATQSRHPPFQDLLLAVRNYNSWLAAEWRSNGREFPGKQHPSTWLRGEMWEQYAAASNVVSITAFNSPEELEGQRLMMERLHGQAQN